MTNNQNLPSETDPQAPVPASYAPAYPAFSDAEEEKGGGPGVKRYLLAILRYKWLVLLLGVLGAAGGVIASKYVQLRYNASATVWLDRGNEIMGTGPIRSSQLLPTDAWVDLLRSFVVIDTVVLRQRLYITHSARDTAIMAPLQIDTVVAFGDYRLTVRAKAKRLELRTKEGGVLVDTARAGQPIGAKLGFFWTPPLSELRSDRKVDFSVVPPRDASNDLLRTLGTAFARNGIYLRISYSGDNPRQVAGVVNDVVDRYLEVAANLKRDKMTQLISILEGQLQYAESNLTGAESALQTFLVQTITKPTEPSAPLPGSGATRTTIVTSYFDTKIQSDNLRRDREGLESALASSARGDSLSLDALSIVAAAQQSPELGGALGEVTQKRAALRALQQQYTDEHVLVRRAKSELEMLERTTIPTLGRRLVAELQTREAALRDVAQASATELEDIPPRIIEEGRLRRALLTAERLATDLRTRVENARLAAATTVPDVSILDRAVTPRRPAIDQRMRIVLLGVMGSLGLGLALALLLDRLDPRLRYAEQVTDEMGLSIIGAVPSLMRPKMQGLSPAPSGPEVLEALRAIRLGLMHAYGSAGPIMITISSPGSGDGKTFVTSNLGLAFADLGLKTLVIDGDTRRGTLHRLFGINRKPGLTDYLVGAEPADAIIYPTKFPQVDILPSGSRQTNAPELLASAAMGELLARIRAEYQVILIDSPPLGAGVDPLVLATLSSNLLLVMRTGLTQITVAAAKLKMIDRLPIRLLGTILNGYDAGESYRYYSYMPGYETSQEEEKDSELLPA